MKSVLDALLPLLTEHDSMSQRAYGKSNARLGWLDCTSAFTL